MAAKSVTISNTKEAIANGAFKGQFVDNIFEFDTIRYHIGKGSYYILD
jgi:hypothetical protein